MPCQSKKQIQPMVGPALQRERKAVCESCPDRDGDLCLLVEAKHPGRSSITNGIRRGDVDCPKGDWPESVQLQKRRCPTCDRLWPTTSPKEECAFCKNKRVINQRVRPTRRGPFTYTGDANRFVSNEQFAADVMRLAALIPPETKLIAGVARSGLAAATMVAMQLHLPLVAIRQTAGDIVSAGNGWRLGGDRHVETNPNALVTVIDDTVMTGNSLNAIRDTVRREFSNYLCASVYCNPAAATKPDIHAVDLPWPHLLEWNLFNSVLTPNMAVDFDGILCWDCKPEDDDDGERYEEFIEHAAPKYIARRVPIPLIVTARIERYRKATERWLRRHGIRWGRLIMHPAKTLAERRRDDIAAYKARHFKSWASRHSAVPAPSMFVESDPGQARRIAALSRRLVVCPTTAETFGE
ncbi:MAG: hypothetical protein AAF958_00775 [Planctomycetota bacterium]